MSNAATATAPTLLRERVEVAYMAATGRDTPEGAQEWAAERLGVNPATVRKWLLDPSKRSHITPTRQSVRQLEMLEQIVRMTYGESAMVAAAEARRKRR